MFHSLAWILIWISCINEWKTQPNEAFKGKWYFMCSRIEDTLCTYRQESLDGNFLSHWMQLLSAVMCNSSTVQKPKKFPRNNGFKPHNCFSFAFLGNVFELPTKYGLWMAVVHFFRLFSQASLILNYYCWCIVFLECSR